MQENEKIVDKMKQACYNVEKGASG